MQLCVTNLLSSVDTRAAGVAKNKMCCEQNIMQLAAMQQLCSWQICSRAKFLCFCLFLHATVSSDSQTRNTRKHHHHPNNHHHHIIIIIIPSSLSPRHSLSQLLEKIYSHQPRRKKIQQILHSAMSQVIPPSKPISIDKCKNQSFPGNDERMSSQDYYGQ